MPASGAVRGRAGRAKGGVRDPRSRSREQRAVEGRRRRAALLPGVEMAHGRRPARHPDASSEPEVVCGAPGEQAERLLSEWQRPLSTSRPPLVLTCRSVRSWTPGVRWALLAARSRPAAPAPAAAAPPPLPDHGPPCSSWCEAWDNQGRRPAAAAPSLLECTAGAVLDSAAERLSIGHPSCRPKPPALHRRTTHSAHGWASGGGAVAEGRSCSLYTRASVHRPALLEGSFSTCLQTSIASALDYRC